MNMCIDRGAFGSPQRIQPLPADYWQTGTLVNVLRNRAESLRDEVVYRFLVDGDAAERTLTFGELDHRAQMIACTLRKLCGPGDRAMLLFQNRLDCIAGLFGCFYAGVVGVSGVSSSGRRSIDRFINITRDAGATVVLGTAGLIAKMQRATNDQSGKYKLQWVPLDRIEDNAAETWEPPPTYNDSLALLQYTSGSTGDPRGVMLTHRNLLHNLQGQILAFGYRQGDRGVSWLPFSHDMGLIGVVLMAVYGAMPCILFSPFHFVQQPLLWLRAISKYKATVSGAPNFAYDLCVRRISNQEKAGLDLSDWRMAFNGGEPVRSDTVSRFATAFEQCGFRAEAMHPCYGLAEATLLVAGGRFSKRLPIEIGRPIALDACKAGAPGSQEPLRLVGCGSAMPGLDLKIVNPKDASVCGIGEVGEIWVSGPSVAPGYYGHGDDAARSFTACLDSSEGPYLRTGDLGFLSSDELFIAGRLKDLIVIRGANYYPQDIEKTAEASHSTLREGSAVAFSIEVDGEERPVLVCELSSGCEALADEVIDGIRRAVLEHHELRLKIIALASPRSIPKTPNGKVQRRLCRKYFEARTLNLIRQQNYDTSEFENYTSVQRREALQQWFERKVHTYQVTGSDLAEIPFAHLDFDSLRIMELRSELEDRFGVRIEAADLIRFGNLTDLETWVLEQLESPIGRRLHSALMTGPFSNGPETEESGDSLREGKLRLRRQQALRRAAVAATPKEVAETAEDCP